jgi:hypothetical protein
MPVLRYFVGAGGPASVFTPRLLAVEPAEGALAAGGGPLVFSWTQIAPAVLYRLEIRDQTGTPVLNAVLQAGVIAYVAPPFLATNRVGQILDWRVVALNAEGDVIQGTPWLTLEIGG